MTSLQIGIAVVLAYCAAVGFFLCVIRGGAR